MGMSSIKRYLNNKYLNPRGSHYQIIIFFGNQQEKKNLFQAEFLFYISKTSSVQLFPNIIKINKPNLRIINTNNR